MVLGRNALGICGLRKECSVNTWSPKKVFSLVQGFIHMDIGTLRKECFVSKWF